MWIVPMAVGHTRIRPRRNRFQYKATYVAVSLDDIEKRRRTRLFAINGRALFSLRSRDYGNANSRPGAWIRDLLQQSGIDVQGEIVLLTLPRVFGYAFNPVSFWFCFDGSRALRAVVAEVNNTFGERHFYVCARPDGSPIEGGAPIEAAKEFHVSPFIAVKGRYRFRFRYDRDGVGVSIDLADDEGPLLSTWMTGKPQPLTDAALFKALLLSPLQALKVIALIHYQAAKLVLKGVPHFPKPSPPAEPVSGRPI